MRRNHKCINVGYVWNGTLYYIRLCTQPKTRESPPNLRPSARQQDARGPTLDWRWILSGWDAGDLTISKTRNKSLAFLWAVEANPIRDFLIIFVFWCDVVVVISLTTADKCQNMSPVDEKMK